MLDCQDGRKRKVTQGVWQATAASQKIITLWWKPSRRLPWPKVLCVLYLWDNNSDSFFFFSSTFCTDFPQARSWHTSASAPWCWWDAQAGVTQQCCLSPAPVQCSDLVTTFQGVCGIFVPSLLWTGIATLTRWGPAAGRGALAPHEARQRRPAPEPSCPSWGRARITKGFLNLASTSVAWQSPDVLKLFSHPAL